MNITFVIGNGFDLNLGLRTKYEDFLKEYVTTTSGSEDIQRFKNDILKDFKTWSFAEEAFGRYTKEYLDIKNAAEVFCDCHEDFCIALAQYLEEEQSWLGLEKDNNKLLTGFAKAISSENLIRGFREVQQEQIRRAMIANGGGYIYNFLNFNYTRTLDKCIQAVSGAANSLGKRTYKNTNYQNQIGQSIHVHGYTHRDMVLGVNDETQIAAPEIFSGVGDEYKYQIIKQKTNEMNEQNIDIKAAKIIAESHLIYIYGMSLGRTDALWWNRIIETMIVNPEVHVIIHCFDAPKNELIRRRLQTFDKGKKTEFLSYSNAESKKLNQLENRLHIDRANIFAALKDMAKREVPSQEEIKELIS